MQKKGIFVAVVLSKWHNLRTLQLSFSFQFEISCQRGSRPKERTPHEPPFSAGCFYLTVGGIEAKNKHTETQLASPPLPPPPPIFRPAKHLFSHRGPSSGGREWSLPRETPPTTPPPKSHPPFRIWPTLGIGGGWVLRRQQMGEEKEGVRIMRPKHDPFSFSPSHTCIKSAYSVQELVGNKKVLVCLFVSPPSLISFQLVPPPSFLLLQGYYGDLETEGVGTWTDPALQSLPPSLRTSFLFGRQSPPPPPPPPRGEEGKVPPGMPSQVH